MRWSSCGVVVMSLALLANTALADTVQKRVDADAHGQVDIVNVAGSVDVRGWDRAEIEVKADIGSSERLEISNDGRHTLVKVVSPGRRQSRAADLIVQVPNGSSLAVNTVSADQKIKEVRGSQRLQSVSGEIETAVWAEDLEVKTISGDVRVQGRKSPTVTNINTVSGSISLQEVAGEVELQTVSGDAQVRMGEMTRGRARTTNGTVEWRAKLAPDARVDAEAINGDLMFRFDGKVDAEIDIQTFNGEIDNCFGPKAKRSSEFAPGQSVRFVQGKGGARVNLKTLNGGVEICNH